MKQHHYNAEVLWTGNLGKGTVSYKDYNRNHTISVSGKSHDILGSSDASFLGDASRFNPEELLLTSVSSCHMLWYLHLCASHNVIVTSYIDAVEGSMEETRNGSGRFTEIILKPSVVITKESDVELAKSLHKEANKMCFIANSLNFKVAHKVTISIEK